MRCSECGHSNIAGSLFCERCGADLAAPAPPPPPPSPAVTAPAPPPPSPPLEAAGETRECPACGHANRASYVACEACGRVLTVAPLLPPRELLVEERPGEPPASAPTPLAATPGQLVTGPQKGKVKLVVEQGMVLGKQFLLAADEMLVGREDPGDDLYPEIDLSGLDEGFVHRRHARLSFEGSFLFVTHLGGHNRTFVNNRPIADGLAHPLDIGDTVRFGKVVLRLIEA